MKQPIKPRQYFKSFDNYKVEGVFTCEICDSVLADYELGDECPFCHTPWEKDELGNIVFDPNN